MNALLIPAGWLVTMIGGVWIGHFSALRERKSLIFPGFGICFLGLVLIIFGILAVGRQAQPAPAQQPVSLPKPAATHIAAAFLCRFGRGGTGALRPLRIYGPAIA